MTQHADLSLFRFLKVISLSLGQRDAVGYIITAMGRSFSTKKVQGVQTAAKADRRLPSNVMNFINICNQLFINAFVQSEFKLRRSHHVKETRDDKLIPCELFISNTDSFGL